MEYVYNSLPYCDRHIGVAVLNARRHTCNYCLLLNAIIIRDSPKDDRHTEAMRHNVMSPVQLGLKQTYIIKQFCSPVVLPGPLKLDLSTGQAKYNYKGEGRYLHPVPVKLFE